MIDRADAKGGGKHIDMNANSFLFVSHVSEDRLIAMKIVSELERRGVRCWIAPRNVRAGQPFDDEIVDAIETSLAVLLLFSDACNESEYIRREVTVAGESQKTIIPFRVEDAYPRRGLRIRLSDLHWIDGFVALDNAISEVLHAVDSYIAAKNHSEPASKADATDGARRSISSDHDSDLSTPSNASNEDVFENRGETVDERGYPVPVNQADPPRILVIGVGGAGGNAVNNMMRAGLHGCEFIVCNTDEEALELSAAPRKIQLGIGLTRGKGAGGRPDVGRAAAEEAIGDILETLQGSDMVFITAGMGGGTGSAATPVIARVARGAGILTVGVVTKPFHFEGVHRMKIADAAIEELQKYVDTLIIIPNQNLFLLANERTTFADAFKMADDVLHAGVRGVTDLLVLPGQIKLDLTDIRRVMSGMGKAMMGTGEAKGKRRAIDAAEAAINNPLLEGASMKGAPGVVVNIAGSTDVTLFEVDEAVAHVQAAAAPDATVIFGSTFDETLTGRMRVLVIAAEIAAGDISPVVSHPPSDQQIMKRARGWWQRLIPPAASNR